MAQELNIEQKLADLLDTRDFQPELTGKDGRPCDADEAKVFTFDYVAQSGKNYGTMVIVLGNDNEMIIMYGDNLGKTMESTDDRDEFFEFQHQLMDLANRNRWTGTLTDISKTKKVKATLAAIAEGLFEGYYGNKRTSYSGEPTEARLVINHNRVLGENDKRYRYVESLFIETADRERFKLQFTNLAGGRAMLEHVRQGGKPYDIRGCHINEMVTEMKVLSRFNRASQGRVVEGVTQEITTQAQSYYQSLRESVKRMSTPRGYSSYFESWHPAEIGEQEELVENIKTMFIEQTLDSRIEEALPLLARIQQQGNAMKEADIFESWINRLAEGTWLTPETEEQVNKLKELLSKDLIVGPDATNAKMLLGDIVGDDILNNRLEELPPDANAWNDTEIMARLKDLGIDTSPQEPAGVLPDGTEPDGTEPGIQPEQPVAPTQDMPQEPPMAPISEADDIATFESINAIRKAAGLPVVESRNAEGSEYIDELVGKILALEKPGMSTNSDNDDFYKAVYDELIEIGMTPKAARYKINYDEDFISDVASAYHHFSSHPEVKEGAAVDAYMAGKSPALAHFADQLDKSEEKPLAECNMTMEGEYCPEHGLMECGGMYEMGTVAGSMAPVMGEGAGSKWYVTHELRTGDADRIAGPFADQQQAQAWMNDNLPMHLDDEGQYSTSKVVEGHDEMDEDFGTTAAVTAGSLALGTALGAVKGRYDDMKHMEKDNSQIYNRQQKERTAMQRLRAAAGFPSKNDPNVKTDEGNDDPMNSNSAITGAYYESKSDDALLARIKSLALIK